MSTIEDFENAPVGATAEDGKWVKFRPTNDYCSEWVEVLAPSNPKTEGASRSNRDMFCDVYTLDPSPVTPTTAREALALAWELAHPIKKGDVIPEGDVFLSGSRDYFTCEKAYRDTPVGPSGANWFRTLDPLPDPEPDWLDAPAVLAWSRWDDVRREKVWSEINDGWYRSLDGEVVTWPDLEGVTPLYPKEEA